jgi:membrane-associated HD superfamily phosphohydrolase
VDRLDSTYIGMIKKIADVKMRQNEVIVKKNEMLSVNEMSVLSGKSVSSRMFKNDS